MSDNVAITAGSGTTIAADEVVDGTLGTVKVQYVKIMDATLDGTTKAAVGANGLKVDGSGATQPVSAASLPLPSGAATAAKQPALGTAGSASSDVISVQGVASMTALKVDGSGVTQPVSAASLPLPTGASTAAKQPALGTAGTASSDVITVQGITSMTALKVDGSGVTQPVSGTVTANAGTNLNTSLLALETGGNLATIAGAVSSSKIATKAAAADFADGAIATLGTKADAKSTATDTTAITLMQVAKQISASVQAPPSQAVTNAGTFAVQAAITAASGALASGSVASGAIASGAVASGAVASGAFASGSIGSGAMVDVGAIADAAVTAGATGSLSAKLRSISRDLVANIVLAAGTNLIGKFGIDQTTPGTTDSISVKSQAFAAVVTLTRTADTNAYTANDILGSATGSTAALTFSSMGPSGKEIVITSAALEIDAAAIISGEINYRLYLYNVTPPSALGDNAAFDLPSGDRASFLGFIDLGLPVDLGSTLYCEANTINKQLTLSGTSLFGYLVTNGGYTPTSARVYKITLHSVAV